MDNDYERLFNYNREKSLKMKGMIYMKIAKRLCPVCHNFIKVAHVDTVNDIKIRKCYCAKCGLTIRLVQKNGEEERVYETWKTNAHRTRLEEVLASCE